MSEVLRIAQKVVSENPSGDAWLVEEARSQVIDWKNARAMDNAPFQMPILSVQTLSDDLANLAGKSDDLAQAIDAFETDASFVKQARENVLGVAQFMSENTADMWEEFKSEREAALALTERKAEVLVTRMGELRDTIEMMSASDTLAEAAGQIDSLLLSIDTALDREYDYKKAVYERQIINGILGIF
jgi:hypothetical protein